MAWGLGAAPNKLGFGDLAARLVPPHTSFALCPCFWNRSFQ